MGLGYHAMVEIRMIKVHKRRALLWIVGLLSLTAAGLIASWLTIEHIDGFHDRVGWLPYGALWKAYGGSWELSKGAMRNNSYERGAKLTTGSMWSAITGLRRTLRSWETLATPESFFARAI